MKRIPNKREELFCQEVAKGSSLTDAWLASHPRMAKNATDEDRKGIGNRASRLRAKPYIAERIAQIQKSFRISDISSLGETMAALRRNLDKAEADGDHKAVAQLLRLKAQMEGGLTTDVRIREEEVGNRLLLDRLTRGRPDLAAALQQHLADESFGYTNVESEPTGTGQKTTMQ